MTSRESFQRINLVNAYRRIFRRLGVTEGAGAPGAYLSPWVTLIHDVAPFLRTATRVNNTVEVAGVGLFVVATVPAGKRWHIMGGSLARSAGDFTMNQFSMRDPAGNETYVAFPTAVGTLAWNAVTSGAQYTLDADWKIVVYVNAGTTWGNISSQWLVEEEDLF